MNAPTPIIAFGDIHGSKLWKKVVSANPDCIYVFLGDYLDPYEKIAYNILIDNLKEKINFKRENSKNVVLLLGNHDGHYFRFAEQGSRYNMFIANEVADIFKENLSLFQNAFQVENLLFTHAGVSQKWFDDYFKGDICENIADQLNYPTPEQQRTLGQCGFARGGSYSCGGIFWADSSELEEPLQGFTQIVGHTRILEIQKIETKNGKIWFCDALWQNQYLKISSDLQKFDICTIKALYQQTTTA